MTRSQKLASFIAYHSFVSCYEPTKVEEALQDPYWINAMYEELNNFTRNEVWTLEERPKGARVIGTKCNTLVLHCNVLLKHFLSIRIMCICVGQAL